MKTDAFRILALDDEPEILDIGEKTLKQFGYDVVS